jgi:hypothetical protein
MNGDLTLLDAALWMVSDSITFSHGWQMKLNSASLMVLSLAAACGRTALDQNQSRTRNGGSPSAGSGGSPSAGSGGSQSAGSGGSGVFTATGSMSVMRIQHTATLLPNGQVLVAGGFEVLGDSSSLSIVARAELYDPASASFRSAETMVVARGAHTASLLPTGKVLIAGGLGDPGALSQAEIYDPKSGKFTATGSMSAARYGHQATALANGLVLITGGYSQKGSFDIPPQAELYDPERGEFSTTGAMVAPAADHSATLLPNGKVLILGGRNSNYYSRAELYDPATSAFANAGHMAHERWGHVATLLSDGKVLVTGGWGNDAVYTFLASTEVYDPISGSFTPVAAMGSGRGNHTATLLPNGQVLVAGGWGGEHNDSVLPSAELYDPSGSSFSVTGPMAVPRAYHTATLLREGKVLVVGGRTIRDVHLSAELYD